MDNADGTDYINPIDLCNKLNQVGVAHTTIHMSLRMAAD